MKSVSAQYKDGMSALLRERSYVRVIFDNIDTAAATDGYWTDNGAESYSEVATLDYAYAYGDTVATLELNRWTLDGKSDILTTGVNDGFVSSQMSDADGEFSTASVITRVFSEPHDFVGFTITFDSRTREYPRQVTVDFRANGASVSEVTTAPTSPKWPISNIVSGIDEITITFDEALPYRRPRVQATIYGLEQFFENDDIIETLESNDVDPISRRLPNEKLRFTLLDFERKYDPDNPQGVYSYIDVNAPIKIQYGYTLPNGTIEWLKADRYLLNAKPTVKNAQATFTGVGLIESMNGTFYKSQLGNKSFYDMAVEVLQDANLTPTEEGNEPWEIDDSLRSIYTTAVLPVDTHKNCLQLIAHACRCRLYTDDDNVVHIKPFGVTVRGIYSGSFSDNGHLYYSEWTTVDSGTPQIDTYVTLELNRWVLDLNAEQIIIPDDYTGRGFVGDALSDANGNYTTDPQFERSFDVEHDLPVLSMRFDAATGDHPRTVIAQYYKNGSLVATTTMSDISSDEISIETPSAIDCDLVHVTMDDVLPYTRARITKVYYRETDFTLNFQSISENSQEITKIDKLRSVTVAKSVYTSDSEAVDLYEETTTKESLHVEFGGLCDNVQVAVTGGSLVSSAIYGRAADLVLTSGTKTVKIMGNRIAESEVVVSYPVSLEGETDAEQNPLITTDAQSDALAAHVAAYLQMRNTYDAKYRGNPELEVGDIIGLQTRYTDEMDALILVDEITFDGALHGRMKVKGLI